MPPGGENPPGRKHCPPTSAYRQPISDGPRRRSPPRDDRIIQDRGAPWASYRQRVSTHPDPPSPFTPDPPPSRVFSRWPPVREIALRAPGHAGRKRRIRRPKTAADGRDPRRDRHHSRGDLAPGWGSVLPEQRLLLLHRGRGAGRLAGGGRGRTAAAPSSLPWMNTTPGARGFPPELATGSGGVHRDRGGPARGGDAVGSRRSRSGDRRLLPLPSAGRAAGHEHQRGVQGLPENDHREPLGRPPHQGASAGRPAARALSRTSRSGTVSAPSRSCGR